MAYHYTIIMVLRFAPASVWPAHLLLRHALCSTRRRRGELTGGTPFVPTPSEGTGAQGGSIPEAREAGCRRQGIDATEHRGIPLAVLRLAFGLCIGFEDFGHARQMAPPSRAVKL
jgi:hypothetical protein